MLSNRISVVESTNYQKLLMENEKTNDIFESFVENKLQVPDIKKEKK